MKRVLRIGTVVSLGLMTAAAGQDSLGRGPLAPDNQPSGYTGAEPSLLGPGGPNWEPSDRLHTALWARAVARSKT